MKHLLLKALGLMILLAISVSAGDGEYDIEVSVEDIHDDEVEVYGAFSASENQFGGIELVFYKDVYSYSIRAIESVRDLMTSPMSSTVRAQDRNVVQIVRIFLKPTPVGNNQVRLSGNMTVMVNTAEKGEPLFRLMEKPLEFTMVDNQQELLTVDPGTPGRKVDLALVLRVKEDPDRTVAGTEIRFSAYYSLFNEDKNSFEIENEPCRLTFDPGESDRNGLCRHSRVYNLDNGDSLLYIVDYDIDAGRQLADGTIDFTVAVRRFFFENPTSLFSKGGDNSTGADGYGDGHRSVDCVVSVNGKDRRVRAEIEDGRITDFMWDNIRLMPTDIVRNWDDIVGLLKRIETTGDYAYRQPTLNDTGGAAPGSTLRGFLASPDNYTGDRVSTTTYSKSISVSRREDTEIQIPFTGNHRLPFDGYEIIRLEMVDRQANDPD